jgi:hypothetical protein
MVYQPVMTQSTMAADAAAAVHTIIDMLAVSKTWIYNEWTGTVL